MKKTLSTILLFALVAPMTAQARTETSATKRMVVEKYSGPRFGVSVLAGDPYQKALDKGLVPVFSQFGWQFETRFASSDRMAGLIEWVPLIGGLDQNVFIPSFSMLVGLRIKEGFEFGIGPNISITQVEDPSKWFNLVIAIGQTIDAGDFAFPIHLAVVPQKGGARTTLLFGFSWQ